jgi:large subunit ribosomal protein L4
MEAKLYNQQGKETGSITLPESIFAVKWNNDLVQQVVLAMQANARNPIAHTKDRSEVSGTGKKPWKQKGTGSARHGSRRSPIWRTGGVAHGPRNERDYSQKINKKMRTKALFAVLSRKLEKGEILFVDDFTFEKPKTALAKGIVTALAKIDGYDLLAKKKKNALFLALPANDEIVVKSFRNFGNLYLDEVRNLNPVEVMRYKYLVFVGGQKVVEVLQERDTKKKA